MDAERREREGRLVNAVHDLAGTEHGVEFLRWLMAECGVFSATLPADVRYEAFCAGKREVGLRVLALCAKDGCASAVVDDLREVEIE